MLDAYGTASAGTIILARVLSQMAVGALSDPGRQCLTNDPAFDTVWDAVRGRLAKVIGAGRH